MGACIHNHCSHCTESECNKCEFGTCKDLTAKECLEGPEWVRGCETCLLIEEIFWTCQSCGDTYEAVEIGNGQYIYCQPTSGRCTSDHFLGCASCATTYIAEVEDIYIYIEPPSDSVTATRCRECVPGYIDPSLWGFCALCSDLLQFCLYCSKIGESVECKLCLTGFILNIWGECVEATCKVNDCGKCLDESRCEICKRPFALTSQGECLTMSIAGCIQSLDNQCLKCNPQFAPYSPDATILYCLNYSDSYPNAYSCAFNSEGTLLYLGLCSEGYFPDIYKGECLPCSQVDPYCLICAELEQTYTSNSRRCVVCIPGYKLILTTSTYDYDHLTYVVLSHCQKEGCNSYMCAQCEIDIPTKCKTCFPNYIPTYGQTQCVSCMSQNVTCSRCFIQWEDGLFTHIRECYECPGPHQLSVNLDRNCPQNIHPLDCDWRDRKISCIFCQEILNCYQKSCKMVNEITYCGMCKSTYLLAFTTDQFISNEHSNYPYLLSKTCISEDSCLYFWDLNSNICFIGTNILIINVTIYKMLYIYIYI